MNHPSQNRVLFLDNLRYVLVFGVVIQHAANSYIGLDWWPVMDSKSGFVSGINTFLDGFLMPSLFFLAGYFFLLSAKKKSLPSYIKAKLKRLGLPWLFCTLFICPVLPFVYHFTRNGFVIQQSFWSVWKAMFKNAATFYTGFLPPMDVVMENILFYQRYMWFLGLLFLFFVIFGCLYHALPSWFDIKTLKDIDHKASISRDVKIILCVGLITFVGSSIIIMTMFAMTKGISNPETWVSLGNLVQFRISRIFLHTSYFILGIVAYKNLWVERKWLTGHIRAKGGLLLFVLVLFFMVKDQMINCPEHLEELFGLMFWLVLNFVCITALVFFVSLFFKFMNKPSRFNEKMANSSYNVYLSHYIFINAFQLALLPVLWMPGALKFVIVFVLSLISSVAISCFLVEKYPGKTALMMFGLFLILCLSF
ncbi:MAG: acyltransferase family protein [Deltaproteobacteria bacterium]|uniref:acyltransferase family protein n=1 Tax=Desulfobacula sp. TaxID=2593537 RepID=UPI00198CE484|nr:acyltransferase family protein [Candidatus Desulfobacula maris]MBL6992695.1 acyltransferase family protein [Desulfobacula sp.]